MAGLLRVLYVDDEPDLLEIGRVFLEQSGFFSVATIGSAPAALERLDNEQFDAIISDYQMPGMDGIQFLAEVRERFGPVPFILFTGKGREEVVIQAINRGADFYLQKGGEPGAQFAELVHKIKAAASRKKADDALRKSEERYRNIVEDQTELISRFTPDGTHAFVNEAYCRYFGLKREDILGQRFRPLIPKDDVERVQKFLASLTPEHPVDNIEHRIIMPDGSVRWQRWSDRAIFDDSGNLIEYQSVGRDITEVRQAENERLEYQTRLKEVIEFLPDATLAIDQQKRIIVWNKAIEQMTGIPAAEMIGKGDHAYAVPFYGEARPQLMDLVLEDSEEIAARYPAIRREGDALIAEVFCNALYNNKGAWVFAKASPLYDSIGNIVGAIESIRDITERKVAEEELRMNQNMLDQVLNTIPQTVFWKDRDSRYLGCNSQFARAVGLETPGQIIGKMDFDLPWPREEAEAYRSDDRFVMDHNFTKPHIIEPLQQANGSRLWIDTSKMPLIDGQGNVYGVLGVYDDITDRKRAEEALALEKTLIDAIFDSVPGMIYLYNAEGQLVRWNKKHELMTGYTPEELSRMQLLDWYKGDAKSQNAVLEGVKTTMQSGFGEAEADLQKKDGTKIPMYFTACPLTIGGKQYFAGLGIDITGRRKAEEALQASEERHRTILNTAIDGFMTIDSSGHLIEVNEAYCKMSGYTERELLRMGITDLEDIESSAETAVHMQKVMTQGEDRFESRHHRKDGSVFDVEVSVQYRPADEARLVVFFRDITGRRLAEEALRESEVTFKALTDDANDGIFVAVNAEYHTYANRRAGEILGYTVAEFLQCGIRDLAAPNKAEALLENFRKRLTGEDTPKRYETSLRHKDGTIIPVEISAAKTRWHGQAADLIIIHDITDRKQAEEALRESEVRFRTLFQDAADAHLLLVNGIHTDCNQALLTLMRCTREEIIGHSPIELSPEFQPDGLRSEEKAALFIREVFETGSRRLEWMHRRPDGTCFWAEVVATSLIIDGKPTLFGSWRDITERKQAEEELLNNTEELHAANEQLTAVEEELKSQFASLAESEGRVRKKLESLLSPGGDIGVLDLGDIIDPQVLQRLMEDFTRVTGMATAILDTKGTVLVATGWQEICTKFHRVNPVTAGFCTESDLHLAKNMKQGEYVAYHCRNHLWDVVTPLYIGSNHMGNIFTGQFFYDDDIVDESVFIRQAEKYGFDRDAYLAALQRVPKFSRQKISELMDYLVKLTDFISLLSYRNLELARTVTERNTLLTSLQKSEGKFRTLVENIPQKIFLKDLDSRYVTVNENFARDLGISPEEMAGKTDADLFPAEFAANYRANDIRVLETGKTEEFEERYLLNGKETWVHAIKTVVQDEGGEVAGLLGVFWDVTDRRQAEEALRESEVQFRSYVDSAPEGIFIADEKGYYIFVNDAACITTGYTREELLRKNLVDVICPEDIPKAGEHFQSVVTKGSASGELRFVTRNGEVRWWVVKGVRLSPTRFLGFISDTTYRKQAEEALRESEEKYRSLFNQSTEGICLHDLEGRILDVNEMACTQSGYSREELLGLTVFEGHQGQSVTLPPKAEILRTWEQWAPGQRFVIEAEHQRKDGTVYPVEISMGVVRYGNANAILALVKDITGRKLAEEALHHVNKKLKLLSGITRHDINNQLTVLVGYLRMLEKKQPDIIHNEYFQKIATAAQRISSMIQFTGEYEQIGVNAPVWQNPRTLVDTAAKDVQLGKVVVKNDLSIGMEVFADPLIVKVFYNLIDNAVRYGGKITTIRFSMQESGHDHLIVCEDDGNGVPADEKEKVFERGFGKNTGLGLALSREIFSITGITIKETGEPGKGARFEMTVPKGAWRIVGKIRESKGGGLSETGMSP